MPTDPLLAFLLTVLLSLGGIFYVTHMAKLERLGRLKQRGSGECVRPDRLT